MPFSHGPVSCARCWVNASDTIQECGAFRLVRDPGHWGAAEPHTLVLGISKGNTQSKAFATAPFDSVAFKGIRHRILEVLRSVGLLLQETNEEFERRFSAAERDYAFASVVRCSITGMDRKKAIHTADSPNVLPAFRYGSAGRKFVENCVDEHLVTLPQRTSLVLLLGNTDAYIAAIANMLAYRRGTIKRINSVAYVSRDVHFVHLAHPSKGNRHFGAFVQGIGTPGIKRDLARQALASALSD